MFHHGLTLTESAAGARALGAVSMAVVGLVATATTTGDAQAQADLDAAFPLNTPVLISGNVDTMAGKAGDGGTLGPVLTAIGDQATPIVVVVRVEEGADQAGTDTNVIGATDGNSYTGLQALLAAPTALGVKPQIIGAPGLDSQPVVEEMVSLAKKLRGFVYAGAKGADGATPAATEAEAITYRGNFAHRELMVIWPDTAKSGGDNVARALGLRAQIDEKTGWHKTLSNVPLVGVTGLEQDVHFDLTDPTTAAGLLNASEVTTMVRQNGFRFWGNRTCSDDQLWSFESRVRTSQALQDTIAEGLAWAIDKPLTPQLARDIVETINALFRGLKAEGRIIGAEVLPIDPNINSAASLAAGRLTLDYEFTDTAPLESLTLNQRVTDRFYAQFGEQVARL